MKIITSIFLFIVLTFPQLIFAQGGPLVTCTDGAKCNFCDLVSMVHGITAWVVLIAMSIAVILLMYAGYKLITARGEVGVVTEARKDIGNVAVGIFIIILAGTLVDTLMKTLVGADFGLWNEPDCPGALPVTPASGVQVNSKVNTGVVIPTGTTNNTNGGGGTNTSVPVSSGNVNNTNGGGGTNTSVPVSSGGVENDYGGGGGGIDVNIYDYPEYPSSPQSPTGNDVNTPF